LYARAKQIAFLQIADLLAPSLALAYAFTRIGCFLNGCCYGIPTSLPWGVRFPDLPYPVQPTQLYSSAMNFLIFVALTQVQKRKTAAGYTFTVYIALYSVYRFFVEILRKGATASILVDGLTEAQIVSVVMFVVAGVVLWRYRGGEAKSLSEP
jgi:phosphatidylglycerol---prolipoprotein diacylglyceryl transferase